jgi:hypothetical protein
MLKINADIQKHKKIEFTYYNSKESRTNRLAEIRLQQAREKNFDKFCTKES